MTRSQASGPANINTLSVNSKTLGGSGGVPACSRCGGSGMLRLGDQRYRTCLECLGRGQLLQPSLDTLFVPRISVAASASVAG
ncbi:MAG: hypothetical protein WCI65_11410 [Synechococcaceae cyanobacterium ELA263]